MAWQMNGKRKGPHFRMDVDIGRRSCIFWEISKMESRLRPLRFDHPTLFRLARNKEVMVENYWVPVGDGGVWHVDL